MLIFLPVCVLIFLFVATVLYEPLATKIIININSGDRFYRCRFPFERLPDARPKCAHDMAASSRTRHYKDRPLYTSCRGRMHVSGATLRIGQLGHLS